MKSYRPLTWFVLITASACGDDLGECDALAAETLVYGRGNLAATSGQALAHDSCGNGVFCHASAAQGDNRVGAPYGLDFDMVPSPHGWDTLREHAEAAWEAVDEGMMPPRGVGSLKVGDGDWSYERERAEGSPRMPSIYSSEGKEIFRNWLACDMPIVEETTLPQGGSGGHDSGLDPGEDSGVEPADADWGAIYADIIRPNCVLGGCHDDASGAGVLKMGELCGALEALRQAGPCAKRRLTPGDPASFLMEKINDETPSCGSRMPSTGRLSNDDIARLAGWIADGAVSKDCDASEGE